MIQQKGDSDPARHGTVVLIRGSVVDVTFPHPLPEVYTQLLAGDDGGVRIEVLSHLDDKTVRGIALNPTQGLWRGAPVVDTGKPIQVPVGRGLLGRMFNVFGEPVDGRGQVQAAELRSIHRPPVPLSRQQSQREIFGVINVTNRRSGKPFNSDDVAFLSGLASQLGIVIEGAKRSDELHKAYQSLRATQEQLVFSERIKAVGQTKERNGQSPGNETEGNHA